MEWRLVFSTVREYMSEKFKEEPITSEAFVVQSKCNSHHTSFISHAPSKIEPNKKTTLT